MDHESGLQKRIAALEDENEALRAELEQLSAKQAKVSQARTKLMRGGFRLLLPLFDRNKVVRSFGVMMETVGGFAGPQSDWPTREEVLADVRVFMESVVRFLIRRRVFLLVFGLLGAAIPAVQVWLVIQQNEIINNQNKFFEIQVYDIVARSMTEGDRNARLMTGALLANAEPEFLASVVRESFDPSLAGVYRAEGVNAMQRRLDDAAYRGHLIRAAVRSVSTQRQEHSNKEVYARAAPMLQLIVADASSRVPEVMRLGSSGAEIDGDRAEQVDHYLIQVGAALREYARIARANGQMAAFGAQVAPLLRRLSQRSPDTSNRFVTVYQTLLQDTLFDLAAAAEPGAPQVTLAQVGGDLPAAVSKGIAELKQVVPADGIDWNALSQQAVGR